MARELTQLKRPAPRPADPLAEATFAQAEAIQSVADALLAINRTVRPLVACFIGAVRGWGKFSAWVHKNRVKILGSLVAVTTALASGSPVLADLLTSIARYWGAGV